MAQCPGCNRFASLEPSDPEADVELDGLTVHATIRITCMSECCNEEMKEATLEPSQELDAKHFVGHVDAAGEPISEDHELEIEETDVESYERTSKRDKSFCARVGFAVRCICQERNAEPLYEGVFEEEVPSNEMEACS